MSAELAIYMAWQDALQVDATLTALIPAANIIIGPRAAEAPVPSICITMVGGNADIEPVQGSKITGYIYTDAPVFQFEPAIDGNMPAIIAITDAIEDIVLADNPLLNAVGIQNVKKIMPFDYYDERKLLCRAARYSFTYQYKRVV
ncbi:MAG: hypothetical protein ACNYVW_03500 [Methanosarcinales archaeon]